MKTMRISLFALIFATALQAQPAKFQELELDGGQKLSYAVVLPENYDSARSYPALLALPPGGQTREMVEAGLEHYWGKAAAEHGWIVISPAAPGQTFFEGGEVHLPALLDHVASQYKIEGGRFHLAGVSMGGISAFGLALEHPELFQSLSVLPGYPQSADGTSLKRLVGLPIRLYVGGRDSDWLAEARKAKTALEAAGADVELEVFAGESHLVTSLEGGRLFERLDGLRATTAQPAASAEHLGRPVHTYSIVARDAKTGELGVAVQSHWFQVGNAVPWAEAGVGVVATQSFVEASYGPKGLALLRAGKSPRQALDELLAADPQRDVRQVAIVDAQGRVAAWTGPKCIAAAGDHQGAGYSVQANLMDRAEVWPAMARAFEAAEGDLAERMLAALEAAQAARGDIRGRQSAALIVVKPTASGEPWNDRSIDLRVDDNAAPLAELGRLLKLHRAYDAMNRGDEALAKGDVELAAKLYAEAAGRAPQIEELSFWQAVTLWSVGKKEPALEIFRKVFAKNPVWARLVPRLVPAGILRDDPAELGQILAMVPKVETRP